MEILVAEAPIAEESTTTLILVSVRATLAAGLLLHASGLGPQAQQVKLADKIANVRSLKDTPPTDWYASRRREYLNWSERVAARLRGCNVALENYFDQILAEARLHWS